MKDPFYDLVLLYIEHDEAYTPYKLFGHQKQYGCVHLCSSAPKGYTKEFFISEKEGYKPWFTIFDDHLGDFKTVYYPLNAEVGKKITFLIDEEFHLWIHGKKGLSEHIINYLINSFKMSLENLNIYGSLIEQRETLSLQEIKDYSNAIVALLKSKRKDIDGSFTLFGGYHSIFFMIEKGIVIFDDSCVNFEVFTYMVLSEIIEPKKKITTHQGEPAIEYKLAK